jgi:hypothetical protein
LNVPACVCHHIFKVSVSRILSTISEMTFSQSYIEVGFGLSGARLVEKNESSEKWSSHFEKGEINRATRCVRESNRPKCG